MKLIGATSSILLCNFIKCIPFSVVMKVCVPSSYCIKPFSTNSDRYSFNWLKDINALYINLVLVAPPPSAAFKSSSIMSLLLLYFTFHLESNYLYMESQAYVNIFLSISTFSCFISSKCTWVSLLYVVKIARKLEFCCILPELLRCWIETDLFLRHWMGNADGILCY